MVKPAFSEGEREEDYFCDLQYVPMNYKVRKSLCLPGARLESTTTPSYLEEKGEQWVAVVATFLKKKVHVNVNRMEFQERKCQGGGVDFLTYLNPYST